MHPLNRRHFLAGSALAALAACGRPSDEAAKTPAAPPEVPQEADARFVNLYSARHYSADEAIIARFTEETGIEVRLLSAPGEQLIERLAQEGDQTQADLIATVDGGNLWRLADGGFLRPATSPMLEAAVPTRYRDEHQRWWAFAKRLRVIVYNKDAVDPATLTSMNDLATPRFRGKVAVRSSQNTYNLSMLAARIEREGVDAARTWARGVRDNLARPPQGGDMDQIKLVAAGGADAAISNHYYFLRMQNSDAPEDRAAIEKVAVLIPDQNAQGVHVNISGAGVGAYSRRQAQATRLLEFLLAQEAQAMFAGMNYEFPVRPDAELTPGLAAMGRFIEEQIPFDALGRRQPEAARIFEEVGWP